LYAKDTTVSVEKTRAEIERLVAKYGATTFLSGFTPKSAFVQFAMKDRLVKFVLPLPDPMTRGGRYNYVLSAPQREQLTRSRWRGLLLVIKAKLEAVEAGITDFETEFLAQIILPDGSTVGAFMKPQIATAYSNGKMPLMLMAGE
jgi:hypothetical protein